jgi:RHS repeat-associated protein
MAVSSVLKNSHSRTIPRRMPAHVGAGVPANRNVHRGLSHSTYDSHRGEYYVDELLATQTSASNNDISGYTLCANEGQAFALPSTCDVAYGANGAFAFRSAQSGTITFNNATFGDPAPGTPKKGYYRLSGGQRFYAHANHLYSVAALTNQSGVVVERYRYDTYGNRTVLAADGVTTRAVSSYNQQVGFTGRYLDKETGLWFFRARYYSGSLGRFIGRDPLGYVDGMGLYAAYFVPTKLDPKGLKTLGDYSAACIKKCNDEQGNTPNIDKFQACLEKCDNEEKADPKDPKKKDGPVGNCADAMKQYKDNPGLDTCVLVCANCVSDIGGNTISVEACICACKEKHGKK